MKRAALIVLTTLVFSPMIALANALSVTVAGSLQSELGCPGDWQPECAITHLIYDPEDEVWQGTFSIPAGSYEYKAAINDSWDENYGLSATPNGANIPLNLSGSTDVKFFYDDNTHWITDNINSIIATLPGSYQSELGCSGDWDPSCLRSWLQDSDGDGIYSFSALLPIGDYEVKIAIDESWNENYGADGIQNGANIPFSVSSSSEVFFNYNSFTHILDITQSEPAPVPEPTTMILLGTGLVGVAGSRLRRKSKK